ncbi:MAG: histidine kinase [Novosphingobium sp.]|nr:histidine kinase [Novosphingobium sp.]
MVTLFARHRLVQGKYWRIGGRGLYGSTLTRRTGRVISTGRAILALSFLLALWLDPVVPVRGGPGGYVLISTYLLWTALLMVIAWRSWWFDFRLAPLAQGVDILVFLAAVYFTESPFSEFQSPFLAFAAFLLVSAMVRWNWRATAATAVVLLFANLVFGLLMLQMGLDIDLYRFSRRTAYMILLSGILIWLSISRGGGRTITFSEPPGLLGERRDRLLDSALVLTASALGARQVVLAFAASEEPWIEIRRLTTDGIAVERLGPAEFGDELHSPQPTALFDIAKCRLLSFENPGFTTWSGPLHSRLAEMCGVNEGIIVPVQSVTGYGHLMAWDCVALSADDLAILRALADQIGHALDREEMANLARSAAEAGVRHAVARDLHDSVAQFLAGTLFRLEALRRWIREGNDPEGEIDSIKNALRREQGQLRLLIERLRRGEEGDRRTEIADELRALLSEAGTHWHIETNLVLPDRPLPVSVQLSHEIRQLVREAIANAVRHGKCRKVRVELNDEHGMLNLSITDDGIGFPKGPGAIRPRSISERVEALGGQFRLDSTAKGARLDIAIRTGEPA